MKKIVLCLFALAFLTNPSFAQAIDLGLKGEGVKTVKVDKTVIIKVDAIVVSSFPFTVEAPANAGLYFWTYSAGVTASDEGDKLRVTAAPNGPLTISVKAFSAYLDMDGKTIKYKNQFGSASFTVSTEEPPEPKKPPPETGLAFFTFIGPNSATADIANNVALRKRLKDAGVHVWVYAANDPEIAAKGLDKAISEVGGAPCFILQEKAINGKAAIIGKARMTTLSAANSYLDQFIGAK